MNRSLRGGATLPVLALLLSVAAPTIVRAQVIKYNLAAGLSLPNGNFSDRNDAGYALIVGIGMTQPGSPISFRAEGIYTEYNTQFADDNAHAGGVTANAIYDFAVSRGTVFNPYAIGGIGYYSTKVPVRGFEVDSRTNFGWNLGGGIRFALTGFSAYVEARYNSVSDVGIKFTPIVFGLQF